MPQSISDKSIRSTPLIEIPSGQIELRDDRTKQKWKVKTDAFLLGKFPVTQALYAHITNENPSNFKHPEKPVETVTWKEAVLFCNKLSEQSNFTPCYLIVDDNETVIFDPSANGYRLPTEAEWQFACQAGTKEIRYGELDKIAWFKNNSQNESHRVGLKEPNSFGLYDMLGNVWEWCNNIYDETVYGSYRIFRGGGWCDEERSVMATTRRRSHPILFKIDDLGFRLARNLVDKQTTIHQ